MRHRKSCLRPVVRLSCSEWRARDDLERGWRRWRRQLAVQSLLLCHPNSIFAALEKSVNRQRDVDDKRNTLYKRVWNGCV